MSNASVIFGVLRTIMVAGVIGLGGVALNWVSMVSTTNAEIPVIKADLEVARQLSRDQSIKLEELLRLSYQSDARTTINTQSIQTIKELSVVNTEMLNQILMNRIQSTDSGN